MRLVIWLAVVVAAVCTWVGAGERQRRRVEARSEVQSSTAGQKAGPGRRRLIFNDDGDDVWNEQASTPEGFLSVRIAPLAGTHVEAIFYCTTESFNLYTHQSSVAELFTVRSGPFAHNNVETLIKQGRDCLQIVIDFCHERGMEAFWSLRVNDIHDSFTPQLLPQFKKEHPEHLMGEPGDWGKYPPTSPKRYWSFVDFEHSEIRERTFAFIREVAERYDVDGIELDFCRHPVFFRPTLEGRPVEKRHCEMMTDLMRRVRTRAKEVSRRRKRPLLIAARVLGTVELSLSRGLEVEAWLREGLIDLLVVSGGYYPFSTPWEEMVQLAHRHNVSVYACLSQSAMREERGRLECWRAAALNAWNCGVDGIYLFNCFDPHSPIWRELGDPVELACKDKVYYLDRSLGAVGYLGGDISPRPDLPPVTLQMGKPVPLAPLMIGDDVAAAAEEGRLTGLKLRLQFEQVTGGDEIAVALNGDELRLTKPPKGLTARPGTHWFEYYPPPALLRKGANSLTVTLKKHSGTAEELRLNNVQLEIRY
ncbi:MAG TPA: hypothetical protein EYP85_05970 [Armatimonadetes bacterium]|nr:hypothetical protein [Armatimonadota bacterium]